MRNSNCPTLKTKRVLLRSLTEEDTEALFLLRSNKLVNKFIARKPPSKMEEVQAFTRDRMKEIENNKIRFWVILKKENPNVIGSICLWNFDDKKTIAEVGYDLHPDYHKQGFMSEALLVVLNYGFTKLDLNSIEAFTHKDNVSSIKLLNKFGFSCDENRIDPDVPTNKIFLKYNA